MNIVFGADYKAMICRDALVGVIREFGILTDVVELDPDLQDYVEVSERVAGHLQGPNDRGVLICGTGIGVCIVANKRAGIAAARCVTVQDAVDSRVINNANVVCLSAETPVEQNQAIVAAFLRTAFPGDERRTRRLEKIAALEARNFR